MTGLFQCYLTLWFFWDSSSNNTIYRRGFSLGFPLPGKFWSFSEQRIFFFLHFYHNFRVNFLYKVICTFPLRWVWQCSESLLFNIWLFSSQTPHFVNSNRGKRLLYEESESKEHAYKHEEYHDRDLCVIGVKFSQHFFQLQNLAFHNATQPRVAQR